MNKIKITHIITGLDMGGAEKMLYKLLKNMNKEKYDIKIISMMDKGIYGDKIQELGIKVITLNMKQGRPTIQGVIKAKREIKNTDIIQTWMYHADLLGYILYRISSTKKLIWGIRRNNLEREFNKKSTIFIAKINSYFSKKVDVIVSCSIKAKETHVDFGFSNKNMIVIPNGFEMDELVLNNKNDLELRKTLNFKKSMPLIIHVGRWNVLKDHKNFIEALGIVKKKQVNFHAIMVGTNINEKNTELVELIKNNKLIKNVDLFNERKDISTLMSHSDLFVSSSIDEGFPNVIGEAMACELPCVVTDAGDSAYILGELGIVVPIQNSILLANAIIKMLDFDYEKRKEIGIESRARILNKFKINKIVNQYEDLYKL